MTVLGLFRMSKQGWHVRLDLLRMYYTLRHEKWTFLLPVLCLCNLTSDWHITLLSCYVSESHNRAYSVACWLNVQYILKSCSDKSLISLQVYFFQSSGYYQGSLRQFYCVIKKPFKKTHEYESVYEYGSNAFELDQTQIFQNTKLDSNLKAMASLLNSFAIGLNILAMIGHIVPDVLSLYCITL